MDQVNLQISENVRTAMDYAFDEAQQRLVSMNQSFDPFTVTVVDEEGGGSIEAGEEIYRLDTARYVPGFEGGLPDAGASAGAGASDPAAGAGSSADGFDATADSGAGASASPEAEGGVE